MKKLLICAIAIVSALGYRVTDVCAQEFYYDLDSVWYVST